MNGEKSFHQILQERLGNSVFQRENAENVRADDVFADGTTVNPMEDWYSRLEVSVAPIRPRPKTNPYPRRPVRPKPAPVFDQEKLSPIARNAAERLGLPTQFTLDALKKRYRKLAREFHPDAQGPRSSSALFIQAKRDYDLILSEVKRLKSVERPEANAQAAWATAPSASADI